MSITSKTGTNKFNIRIANRRTIDGLDHGLESDEVGFRWISARREEDKFGRIWQPLRKEHLSEQAQSEIKKRMYDVWTTGDLIRRGDLILAFAPKEMIMQLRQENREKALSQEALVTQQKSRAGFKQTAEKTVGGEKDFF